MKKVYISLLVISIYLCINNYAWALILPTAKITIRVIDEHGSPMESVLVSTTFDVPSKIKQGLDFVSEKGYTNTRGNFSFKHKTIEEVHFSAKKDGYYKTRGKYHFRDRKHGRWQPWNPEVTLVLRKIENPVPMYARKLDIKIPEIGKAIGFDLIEYDWVAPYGDGMNTDLIFKLEKKILYKNHYAASLLITFPNKFDGVQVVKEDLNYGSELKLPRFAPEAGYERELVRLRKNPPQKPVTDNFEDDNNYIFRIRSEEQNGELLRAMYGKIQGDIKFYAGNSKTAVIIFKYYLNPDYARNLEFDPKQNLFKDLERSERVGLR